MPPPFSDVPFETVRFSIETLLKMMPVTIAVEFKCPPSITMFSGLPKPLTVMLFSLIVIFSE